jgi:hypothetical protein
MQKKRNIMSITNKTRKTLWAKSGNRCVICKIELVQEVESSNSNVIIGQECHIVSEAKTGPRANSDFENDYDGFENLLLLCANDHKKIDESTDSYPVEKLKKLKRKHELWVKETLERDVTTFANDKLNIKSLPLIKSGKELIGIIQGAQMSDFDNEELKTSLEAKKVGDIFDTLLEYIDILGDLTYSDINQIGIDLNNDITELKELGFLIFGMKRQINLKNSNNKDLGNYETASIVIVRKDNPSIVSDFLIAKFPKKINLGI